MNTPQATEQKTEEVKKPRVWSPHDIFVPQESANGYMTMSDGHRYRRDLATGVIKSVEVKVRGKSARRAERARRRAQRNSK